MKLATHMLWIARPRPADSRPLALAIHEPWMGHARSAHLQSLTLAPRGLWIRHTGSAHYRPLTLATHEHWIIRTRCAYSLTLALTTRESRITQKRGSWARRSKLVGDFVAHVADESTKHSAVRAAALRLRKPQRQQAARAAQSVTHVDARTFIESRAQQHLHFHYAIQLPRGASGGSSDTASTHAATRSNPRFATAVTRYAKSAAARDEGRGGARRWAGGTRLSEPVAGSGASTLALSREANWPSQLRVSSPTARSALFGRAVALVDRRQRLPGQISAVGHGTQRRGMATLRRRADEDQGHSAAAFIATTIRTRATRRIVRTSREDDRPTAFSSTHSSVRLIWRRPQKPDSSEGPGLSQSIERAIPAPRVRASVASPSATQSSSFDVATATPSNFQRMDSAAVDRFAEDIIRRIDKRARIERERRGL